MKNNISTEKVLSIINKAIDIGFNSNTIKCLLEVLEKALDKANAQNCILHHLNKITNDKNYIINDDSFIEYLNTFPLDVEKVYTVYERKIDNIYIRDPYDGTRVSDMMAGEWRHWIPGSVIVISAPTGSGKNYYTNKFLIPEINEYNQNYFKNYKVLLLSNRSALNVQNKNSLAESLGQSNLLKMFSDEGRRSLLTLIPPACIMTYHQYDAYAKDCEIISTYEQLVQYEHDIQTQNLYNTVLNPYGIIAGLKSISFDFIIIDEAHFFIEDSLFNPRTAEIYNYIFKQQHNAVKIFMSATCQEILPIICDTVSQLAPTRAQKQLSQDVQFPIKPYVNYYELKQSTPKTNFKITDIDFKTHLPNIIKQTYVDPETNEIINKDKKWLIFVSSYKRGHELKKTLNKLLNKPKTKKTDITIEFINSDSKSSNEQQKFFYDIVNERKFNCNILIATTVFDNGISIEDESVTNVAIDLFDETTTKQCAGRIRIDPKVENKPNINYYVQRYDPVIANQRIRDCADILETFERYYNGTLDEQYVKNCTQKDYWYYKNNVLHLNNFAFEKAQQNYKFFRECNEHFKTDKLYFLRLQYNWLNIDSSVFEKLIQEKNNRIIEFFKNYSEEYTKKELEEISIKFIELLYEVYGCTYRDDRIYHLKTFKDIFSDYNLPIKIDSNNIKRGEKGYMRYYISIEQ